MSSSPKDSQYSAQNACALLNLKQVAEHLHVSPKTIARMRDRGEFPQPTIQSTYRQARWSIAMRRGEAKHAESTPQCLFNVPKQLVKILDRDLAVAGIEKVDEENRSIDVHALRHVFCTWGQEAGISPSNMQGLMRQSDPRLTHDTYTHLNQIEVGANVERLPALQIRFDNLFPVPSIATAGSLPSSLHQTESESGFLSPLMAEMQLSGIPAENEKTLEIIEKTRVFDSEVDGGRTRNLRIDSPVL